MRIVVVDDEVIIRKGLIKLLENSNSAIMSVEEARNGQEALALLETTAYDLVISDIKMPVMDGLQLMEQINSRFDDIEKVIVSGYADFQYAQQAIHFGVTEYIVKPITQDNVTQLMNKLLIRNPATWSGQLDQDTLKEAKLWVVKLVKAVLAEQPNELDLLLIDWHKRCSGWNMTLHTFKAFMTHLRISFQTEMLIFQPDMPMEDPFHEQLTGTVAALFECWRQYLFRQIRWISLKRIPRNKRVIIAVVEQIHNEFGNPDLSIHSLADRVAVTSAYLSKMFREMMNKPITQYISDYRLEQARGKLENLKDLRISQVCEDCGFRDYPYFSKIFKKTYGISPLEYRDKFVSCECMPDGG